MKNNKLDSSALKHLGFLQTEVRQALDHLRQHQEKLFPVIAATFELEGHITEAEAVLDSIGTPSPGDGPALQNLIQQRTRAEVAKKKIEEECQTGNRLLGETPTVLDEASRIIKKVLDLVVASLRAEVAFDLAKHYATSADADAAAGEIPAIKTANARIADLAILSNRTFAQLGNEPVPTSYAKIKASLQLAEEILAEAQRIEPNLGAYLV
jgi:chaperonin cofactor prefoldin